MSGRYPASRIFLGSAQVIGWIGFPLFFMSIDGHRFTAASITLGLIFGVIVAMVHHSLLAIGLAILDIADDVHRLRTGEQQPQEANAGTSPEGEAAMVILTLITEYHGLIKRKAPKDSIDRHLRTIADYVRGLDAAQWAAIDALLSQLTAYGTISPGFADGVRRARSSKAAQGG